VPESSISIIISKHLLQFLDEFKVPTKADRETLINVAYTSLATKLNAVLAKKLAADVVDAVLTVRPPPPAAGNSDSLKKLSYRVIDV